MTWQESSAQKIFDDDEYFVCYACRKRVRRNAFRNFWTPKLEAQHWVSKEVCVDCASSRSGVGAKGLPDPTRSPFDQIQDLDKSFLKFLSEGQQWKT